MEEEGGWSEKAAELDAQMRNPRLGFEESRKIRGGGSLVLKLKGGYRSDRILVMMSVKIK